MRISALILCLLLSTLSKATTVTGFTGSYRNGQAFFTWNAILTGSPTYKLYRSSTKITKGSQLASCEYLGYTDNGSNINHNLTTHDGVTRYWVIEEGATPLGSTKGLFVSTSVSNGSFFYALTVVKNGIEDTAIIPGSNSLSSAVAETISNPHPVLQEIRTIEGEPVEIYGDFISSRVTHNGPLRFKAGWLGFDFSVFRNGATTPQALHIRFHAGGNDFLTNITDVDGSELNLGVEDDFPSGENSGWLGSHQNYDQFKNSNNTVPASGTNYFYTQDRLVHTLDWVIANMPVDSNKVYVDGTSYGANGAFFFCLLHPEKVAAADLTSGMFNFGFEDDYMETTTMNTGEKNREDGNKKFGTPASNLSEGSGFGTYDLVNGGHMIHLHKEKDYPVMYSINGRTDDKLGWTEKTIWYDSVSNNRIGGYYFFDNRDHAGEGKTWTGNNFDMYRYRKNLSYPAFSDCSLNDNPGNGNGGSGDIVGAINGFLDWKETITDNVTEWKVKIYMKDLNQINNTVVVAPSSCIVDITPRRLQKFDPPAGSLLEWSVTHLGPTVQSGSQMHSGGLITIPNVQVFKDTIVFSLTYTASADTFYEDFDEDTYGNASSFIVATVAPEGFVGDNTDCNDNNSAVHPGATEICNGIDENCNVTVDDDVITATISPDEDLSACEGSKVIFSANEGSGFTYKWYLENVAISGATNSTYTSKKKEAGSYKVKVTIEGGCSDFSPTTELARIAKPKAVINPQGSLDICNTSSVGLKAKDGSGIMWQWNKNGATIPGATGQYYTATSVGSYTVLVTDANGCSKTSTAAAVTSSCKSTNELSAPAAFEVLLFPNPANDVLFVFLQDQTSDERDLQLEIFNLPGQRVFSQTFRISEENLSLEIRLNDLAEGIYMLQATSGGGSAVQNFVIAR